MVKRKKRKKKTVIFRKLVSWEQDMLTLPNMLTFIRILFVPFVLWMLYTNTPLHRFIAFILYTIATLTDFFDGYLARRYNSVSHTGKMLDPLADKFIVNLTLVLLVAMNEVPVLPILIILAREFYIFGVRNIAMENKLLIPAGASGKIKTFLQMFAIPCFILDKNTFSALFGISLDIRYAGLILLWGSILFSLTSAYSYSRQVKRLLFKE